MNIWKIEASNLLKDLMTNEDIYQNIEKISELPTNYVAGGKEMHRSIKKQQKQILNQIKSSINSFKFKFEPLELP